MTGRRWSIQILILGVQALAMLLTGCSATKQQGKNGSGFTASSPYTNAVNSNTTPANESVDNQTLDNRPSLSPEAPLQMNTTAITEAVDSLSTSWPMSGNNPWGDHLSPDNTLTPSTVSDLTKVYDVALPGPASGNETYPIEVQGILYVTTKTAQVIAMNATTGQRVWTYTQPPSSYNLPLMNRGVAVANRVVYVLSADDYLTALRADSGEMLFRVQVANPADFYFESMAPLAVDGKVIVGSSGGDEGIRGFVAAYDGESGKKLWQFFTVPERGQSWLSAQGNHGGGAVWTTPTYDPTAKTIYFGTGNPSPDYYGASRPGPDPYTDSVLGVNVDTGKLQFAEQETAHDLWDYDVASPPLLFRDNGHFIVGEAGKDGEWYEWDAVTGNPIIQPVAFVKEKHSPPTAAGTEEWPGPDGGANYGPSAYNPLTHLVYVAGINGPEVIYASPTVHDGHTVDLGTRQNPASASQWTGTITGIDVSSGQVVWQTNTSTPPIGGVTASLGGLVWYGDASGNLEALDAKNGHLVWSQKLGAPIASAPIVYLENGATYVTVVTGGATSLMSLFPYHGAAHVITFRLNLPLR